MSMDPKLSITLDRPREVLWTVISTAKLGRLTEPPGLAELTSRNAHRALYTLLAWLWASIEDQDGDFQRPEEMAIYLKEPDQQAAAYKILIQALQQAGVLVEKKTKQPPELQPPAAGGTTNRGPKPSSNSARPARRTRG
jgi:hypothetical protein